jgi:hypothetical protein
MGTRKLPGWLAVGGASGREHQPWHAGREASDIGRRARHADRTGRKAGDVGCKTSHTGRKASR